MLFGCESWKGREIILFCFVENKNEEIENIAGINGFISFY